MPSAVPNGRTNRLGTASTRVARRPFGWRLFSALPAHTFAAPATSSSTAQMRNATAVMPAATSSPCVVQPMAAAPTASISVEAPRSTPTAPQTSCSTQSRWRCEGKTVRAYSLPAEAGSHETGDQAEAGSRETGDQAEAGSRETSDQAEAGNRETSDQAEAGSPRQSVWLPA